MLLEKSSGIEISELSWILSKMSNIFGTYTSICPFCIKIWKAERLLQTITELSIKELICTGFRKCSTKIGILIFSSAQFVKIMFPLAFSELWPYFEISDFAKVENIVKNIEELDVKHYQSFQGWKGSWKQLQKKSMQLLQKILRHHVGIPAEASQTQYMQAKTSSLRWVKFGSSLCISGSGKETNTIWTPPLLHDDKNDAERWGGNRTDSVPLCLQSCGVFILRHCVGLGAARAKIGKYRLACRGAMPRSQFIPVKIHSGLREGVGHTSPSYNKVCPRLPVWKGWPKRARRVV